MRKIFVIRKYVVANSVEEALEKEKSAKVDDCFLEELSQKAWLEDRIGLNNNIGFHRDGGR